MFLKSTWWFCIKYVVKKQSIHRITFDLEIKTKCNAMFRIDNLRCLRRFEKKQNKTKKKSRCFSCSQRLFYFHIFFYQERTRWRLFQARFVCHKLGTKIYLHSIINAEKRIIKIRTEIVKSQVQSKQINQGTSSLLCNISNLINTNLYSTAIFGTKENNRVRQCK